MKSVLRDWVMELPLRHQGVLVAAVRGCDGAPKENSAKPLVRALRYAAMNPADEREVGMPSAFMAPGFSDVELRGFLHDWDHYPVHFVQHLMHACQVVGNLHPTYKIGKPFRHAYLVMVDKLHLNPERPGEMNARLTEDRIARYGNATGEVDPPRKPPENEQEPDPDAPIDVVITTSLDGVVSWSTKWSSSGPRGPFTSNAAAIDDAVDFFDPAPVRPVFRKEVVGG